MVSNTKPTIYQPSSIVTRMEVGKARECRAYLSRVMTTTRHSRSDVSPFLYSISSSLSSSSPLPSVHPPHPCPPHAHPSLKLEQPVVSCLCCGAGTTAERDRLRQQLGIQICNAFVVSKPDYLTIRFDMPPHTNRVTILPNISISKPGLAT